MPLQAAALAVAVCLSGCALVPAARPGPLARAVPPPPAPGRPAAPAATGGSRNELPSPSPPPQHARGSAGPLAALRAFGAIYVNWSFRNVSARMAELGQASVGQARSSMQLAAAETARDSTLRLGGISNRGTVEAVAPVLGAQDRFVVVTREATVASRSRAYQGLAPAWHVTLATVVALRTRQGTRWVVSAWQPES